MGKRIIAFLLSVSILLTMCGGVSFASDTTVEIATEEESVQQATTTEVPTSAPSAGEAALFISSDAVVDIDFSTTTIDSKGLLTCARDVSAAQYDSLIDYGYDGTGLLISSVNSGNIKYTGGDTLSTTNGIVLEFYGVFAEGQILGGNTSWGAEINADGTIGFWETIVGSTSYVCTTDGIDFAKTHHIVFVSTGDKAKIYIDGELSASHVYTQTSSTLTDGTLQLYAPAATYLSTFKVYTTIPTAADVAALYAEYTPYTAPPEPTATPTAIPVSELFEYDLLQDAGYCVITKYIGSDAEVVIPSEIEGVPVTQIGNSAFESCSSLTSVEIPEGVTTICFSAFNGCSSLTSIGIPKSVTSIGDSAFSDCSSLTEISLPSSITSIGNYAFLGCSGMTKIVIPYGVTSIEQSAFSGCISLVSVEIPESVISVGKWAFNGCRSLKEIVIPGSVTSIGDFAFSDCSGLTSIEILEGVTCIGVSFTDCSSLTSIEIPGSVISLDEEAFRSCSNLASITVASGNDVYHSSGNCIIETESKTLIIGCMNSEIPTDGSVTSIKYCAFYGCSGLKTIEIPESITSIGNNAFLGCSSLTKIEIPDSVTSIGASAFHGCSSLTEITLSSSITNIERFMFYNCTGLKEIAIPSGVTSIGDYAFDGCSSLLRIAISDSVTSIGEYAFEDCSNLSVVYYTGTTEQWDNIIYNTTYNLAIYHATVVFVLDCVIVEQTTVSGYNNILGPFFDGTVYKSDTVISDESYLGTGMTIVITNKATSETYTKEIVVYGDTNGDGKVAAADYMLVKNTISNPAYLTGGYFTAADIDGNGDIGAIDYIKIKSHLAGKYDLYENMA